MSDRENAVEFVKKVFEDAVIILYYKATFNFCISHFYSI